MPEHKNRFVFVSPMWNASQYVGQMLASIVGQSYDNWKIILIDDVSEHNEQRHEANIIDLWSKLIPQDQIHIVWNTEKKWEVANVLHGISMCVDDDIICRIDADDWLTDLDALHILNAAYESTNADAIWTAHRWGYTDQNISGPMQMGSDPYKHPWVSSHLKTFRKRLINDIPYENFTNMNGELVRRAGDQCLYLPILYHAKKYGYIPRCMYHYTIDEQGGLVYQTDDAKFQKAEADFLRKRGYINYGKSWEEVI